MKQYLYPRPVAALLAFLVLTGVMHGCAASQNRPMQLVSGSGPIYPVAAKAERIEGSVVVRYGVSVDGRVINARVESAEPEGIFEDAALTAVRSWRYNPALNAYVNVLSDPALARARAADRALARGERWGPLHGLPVAIKESFAIARRGW